MDRYPRGTGYLKAQIRVAVRRACEVRGDPPGHYEACLRDIWLTPVSDWEWFLRYFEDQAGMKIEGKL